MKQKTKHRKARSVSRVLPKKKVKHQRLRSVKSLTSFKSSKSAAKSNGKIKMNSAIDKTLLKSKNRSKSRKKSLSKSIEHSKVRSVSLDRKFKDITRSHFHQEQPALSKNTGNDLVKSNKDLISI